MVTGTDRPNAIDTLLVRCARSPLRAHRFCADAVQDVALSLLSGAIPSDVEADPERLAAWVRGALRRRVCDLLRREHRRHQTSLAEQPASKAEPDSVRLEEAERVRATLASMCATGAEAAAQLLEWRFLDGLSVTEIGIRLSTTRRNVTYRLRHAKDAFRTAWAQRWGGGGA